MTDSNLKIEEAGEQEQTTHAEQVVLTQTRRSALGLSVAGGLAALLAACGKYVTKFDKTKLGTVDAVSNSDAEGVESGTTDPDGGGTTDPGGGGATATPTPTATSTATPPVEPPSKFCFDTSKAVKVPEANFFVAKALYGNKFSALLAVKVQKKKDATPVVGDLVHILLKKSATESYLAASRRVRSTDEYIDGIGLVFDTLNLNSYVGIQVLVTKGDKQYISELPITYASEHNGKPVYDMSLARTDRAKSDDLFALGFGDSNAPTMKGTSDIATNHTISGLLYTNGKYVAALGNSEWNLSYLIPSGFELKNIFGQSMTSSETLLHDHQSLVVYRPASNADKKFDGYIRYFIYVG